MLAVFPFQFHPFAGIRLMNEQVYRWTGDIDCDPLIIELAQLRTTNVKKYCKYHLWALQQM